MYRVDAHSPRPAPGSVAEDAGIEEATPRQPGALFPIQVQPDTIAVMDGSDRDREIRALVSDVAGPDSDKLATAVTSLYDELRAVAHRVFREERPGHTLQPTALVHETYLRLAKDGKADWASRAEFLGWAARIMRQILLNHARDRKRKKRSPQGGRVPLDEVLVGFERCSGDIEAVHEALEELTRVDERKARIVELRFFGGLSIPEVAELVGLGHATVERDWRFARAWLVDRLES